MGWPRQAWLCVRRAADGALLLRLHRAAAEQDERGGKGRQAAIWSEIWNLETTLALILGLPSTTPIPTPTPDSGTPLQRNERDGCSDAMLPKLQHRLSSLAASVVARNQSPQPNYTTTLQISRELDECRTLMPDSWWHEAGQLNQPFVQVFAQQATKIQYFLVAKLLHQPFMLNNNAQYGQSHALAVAASRSLISAYLGIRNHSHGLFVMCESLEFQAFSASITLLIHLLSLTAGGEQSDEEMSAEDWALVETLNTSLKRTASLMRCNVASQAAQVLDHLTQAARGTYSSPDRFEVMLPYFGKVSISLSRGRKTADLERWDEGSQQQPGPKPFGTIEFSANPFDFVPFSGSLEGELGGDWSSMTDADMDFDWMQTFTFNNGTEYRT